MMGWAPRLAGQQDQWDSKASRVPADTADCKMAKRGKMGRWEEENAASYLTKTLGWEGLRHGSSLNN